MIGLGFLGWTIPAASPAPAFGGDSLFGLFTQSIGENLAHFPTGPALSDKFWCVRVESTWFVWRLGGLHRSQG